MAACAKYTCTIVCDYFNALMLIIVLLFFGVSLQYAVSRWQEITDYCWGDVPAAEPEFKLRSQVELMILNLLLSKCAVSGTA